MTAAVTMRHGGPEAIEIRTDWPVPEVGAADLLVRVTAAALNNTDNRSREGAYGSDEDSDAIAGWKGVPLGFPRIQGIDVAGVVESVGDQVDPTVTYSGCRVVARTSPSNGAAVQAWVQRRCRYEESTPSRTSQRSMR